MGYAPGHECASLHFASHHRGFGPYRLCFCNSTCWRTLLECTVIIFLEIFINCTASLLSKLSTIETACPPCRTTCRLFVSIFVTSLSMNAVSKIIFTASFSATLKIAEVLCPPTLTVRQTTPSTLNAVSLAALIIGRIF